MITELKKPEWLLFNGLVSVPEWRRIVVDVGVSFTGGLTLGEDFDGVVIMDGMLDVLRGFESSGGAKALDSGCLLVVENVPSPFVDCGESKL